MTLSEAKRQRKLGMISLEYYDVIRMTSCPEFMVKAHSTRVTQPQALMLWAQIIMRHNLNADRFRVVWTQTRRCRGGKKNGAGYLKLNVNYLTVGIVLHEMAHVLQYLKFSMSDVRPHGREFVQLFDLLLNEFYSNLLKLTL